MKIIKIENNCNLCPYYYNHEDMVFMCKKLRSKIGDYDRDYSYEKQDLITIPKECPLEEV